MINEDSINPFKWVHHIPLTLSLSLEKQRQKFEQTLVAAQKRLVSFASRHGWLEHVRENFCDNCEIFDSKETFDATLLERCGYPSSYKLPKTYSAALEQRILAAVSPEIYATLYPQGIEEASYEKLLCHEMAHRLHIRILAGEEELMGPVWFFEGFAIYAASQFERDSRTLRFEEVKSIITNRKRTDYRLYAALLRKILTFTSLQNLVVRAGGAGFSDYIMKLISNL